MFKSSVIYSSTKAIAILLCIVLPLLAYTQTSTISGFVYSLEGNPIDGAYILADDGKYGTFSDAKGAFSLELPNGEHTITANSLGYKELLQTIKTDSSTAPIILMLEQTNEKLVEIKVQGSREDRIKKIESVSVQLIEEEFLKESNAPNLMQSLKSIPGINAMDVSTGISKPMIRGMSYYRVVVAQNGIKQEGQQWSNHHGIAIDQQSVSHVEIIKGPASLQYGSDAIGGVINILPTHVPLSGGVKGEVNLVGKTNTLWYGGSGNISFRKGDVYSLLSLTHNNYGDFSVPKTDQFLQPSPVSAIEATHPTDLGNTISNTAGRENAASATVGIVKSWGNSYVECNYYATRTGFFDWQGMKNDSLRAIHEKSERDLQRPWQKVDNIAINHFTNRFFTNNNKLEIALGYQNNVSKEYNYLDDRDGNRSEDIQKYEDEGGLDLLLKLQVWSANAFYTIHQWDRHKTKIGINTQIQNHRTDGYNHILPEYVRHSEGIFITHRYSLSKKWVLNSGARFDYSGYDITESANPNPADDVAILNSDISTSYIGNAFSLGINFIPKESSLYKIHIGKSFRMPSAYELAAYGLHRHEGRFEKGNAENNPEEAIQLDAGWEQKWKNITVSISPFCNYFLNYLYLTPTPTLQKEGQVYEYNQTKALITGSELSVDYTIKQALNIGFGAEYVYAVNLDLITAIPFTPPLSTRTDIQYFFKDKRRFQKNKLGLELLGVAAQEYTVVNELSTPGYIAININARTTVVMKKQKATFYIKATNLLNDRHYNHISFYRRLRIPEPGRDIQVSVSVPF